MHRDAIGTGSISNGANSIVLGAGAKDNSVSNTITIGVDATVAGSGSASGFTFINYIHSVNIAGGLQVYINANGQLGTIVSSIRFKENVRPLGDLSVKLYDLEPKMFDYKDGSGQNQIGLIAEQVYEHLPEIVAKNADGQIQTVLYQLLPVLILQETQKHQKYISNLEQEAVEYRTQIDVLNSRLDKMESMLLEFMTKGKIALAS